MVRIHQKMAFVLVALFSSNSYANAIGSNPANPGIALLKMLLALAVVLSLLWGFATLIKRFHGPSLQSNSGLKLVSTFNLGQREKLLVMQIGEEQLLLGVTSTTISKLHVLPTPLNLQSTADAGNFKQTLKAAISREIST